MIPFRMNMVTKIITFYLFTGQFLSLIVTVTFKNETKRQSFCVRAFESLSLNVTPLQITYRIKMTYFDSNIRFKIRNFKPKWVIHILKVI